MVISFYSIVFLLAYTYFGYPAILRMGEVFRRRRKYPVKLEALPQDSALPSATLIIPAYNEEGDIRQKLENVLGLDYPKEKLEIIVASDASSDGTDDIVRSFSKQGIRLIRLEKRGGKIAAYKRAIHQANGEILIFSDATSRLEKDSLRHMLQNFADPQVGAVSGRLFFVASKENGIGKGEVTYWDYNIRIKQAESRLASLTSVSGTFFAVRKALFPVGMPDDLAEDLAVPLNVVRNGYRTILEPMAVCREAAVYAEGQELRKRARITLQNIRGLVYGRDMLNVFRHGLFAVLLMSHKLLRLLAPLMLIAVFVLNIALWNSSDFFKLFFAAQISFYFAGLLGGVWRRHQPRLLMMVHFFCISNVAIFLGALMWVRRQKTTTWETERA